MSNQTRKLPGSPWSLPLRLHILISFFSFIVLLFTMDFMHDYYYRQVTTLQAAVGETRREQNVLVNMRLQALQMMEDTANVLTGEPEAEAHVKGNAADFLSSLGDGRGLAGVESLRSAVLRDFNAYRSELDRLIAQHKAGNVAEAQEDFNGEVDEIHSRLQSKLASGRRVAEGKLRKFEAELAGYHRVQAISHQGFTWGGAIAAIVLAILLSWFHTRSLTRLSHAAKQVTAGSGPAAMPRARITEVNQLSEALERLIRRLTATALQHRREARRAQASNRAKTRFLAKMSHELRTPLNAVIGFTDMVKQYGDRVPAERREEYLQHVSLSSRHLLQLVEDLLDFAQLGERTVTFRPEELDLDNSVQEAMALVAPSAQEKGLRLVFVPGPAGRALVDQQRLRQILFNLLSNAIKFTESGSVTVRSERREGLVRIAVEDTGVGIAEDDQRRIFEEFEQADAAMSSTVQGAGLGLALTKKLVELQGGRISVESTPGQGSVFSFTLPPHPPKRAASTLEREAG